METTNLFSPPVAECRGPRVVIAEDDDLVRAFFENVLRGEGYRCRSFTDGAEALKHLREEGADLVLSDIHMPGMSGPEFLRAARSSACRTPFVMISGSYDVPLALEAIGIGAEDYLLKPTSVRDIVAVAAKHARPPGSPNSPESAEIESTFDLYNLSTHLEVGGRPAESHVNGLLQTLSEKRIETLEHSYRVSGYALLLEQILGSFRQRADLRELELGALLHDIGKVGVPENVLAKEGPLSSEEWRVMKLHPQIGYELLQPIRGMSGVAEIVLNHHEFFDGRGYPSGLSGERIPIGARIFSVVDAFDAITSDRPYRAAQPFSAARREIQKQRGRQFDPLVVDAFLSLAESELRATGVLRTHSIHR
jgi:putative two-component system response regulator